MIKKIFAVIVLCCALIAFLLLTPMSNAGGTRYVYVDADDNADSVYAKLDTISHGYSLATFKCLSSVSGYADMSVPDVMPWRVGWVLCRCCATCAMGSKLLSC